MVGTNELKGFAKQKFTLQEVLLECIFPFKLNIYDISWHLVKKQKEIFISKRKENFNISWWKARKKCTGHLAHVLPVGQEKSGTLQKSLGSKLVIQPS